MDGRLLKRLCMHSVVVHRLVLRMRILRPTINRGRIKARWHSRRIEWRRIDAWVHWSSTILYRDLHLSRGARLFQVSMMLITI